MKLLMKTDALQVPRAFVFEPAGSLFGEEGAVASFAAMEISYNISCRRCGARDALVIALAPASSTYKPRCLKHRQTESAQVHAARTLRSAAGHPGKPYLGSLRIISSAMSNYRIRILAAIFCKLFPIHGLSIQLQMCNTRNHEEV